MKSFVFFSIMCLTAALGGCAGIQTSAPHIHDTPETGRLLTDLANRNAGLKTYKGIGKIRMESRGVSQNLRAAWICRSPDMLRMDLLTAVPGIPMTKFSTDGNRLFFFTSSDGKSRRQSTRNTSLNNLISIDADVREVVALLCGRVPVRPFTHASMNTDPRGLYHVLTLKDQKGRVMQRIYLTKKEMTPFETEFFNKKGTRTYRVTLSHYQVVRTFNIPFRFVFSDDDGDRFQIDIARFWPAVATSSAVFTLKPTQ